MMKNKTKIKIILCIIITVIGIMLFNLKNVIAQTEKTKIYIDYPEVNKTVQDSIYIHGWIMSEVENKSLEIYIGDTNVTAEIERYARPDVTGTVTGYGTAEQNPLAGYKGTVDLSNFKDGEYKLTIKVINNETQDILAQEKRDITIKKYKAKVYIDYPKPNEQEKNSVYVHGWVMSDAEDTSLEIYVGNKYITEGIIRYSRPDVTGTITGYGTAEQNPLAGYKGTIDLSGYDDGINQLKIKLINNKTKEILAEETRTINVKEYETKTYIDYPKEGEQEKNSVYVHGWVMSDAENKSVKVYIEDKEVTSNIERYARPDVTGTVKGYGTAEQNPLAGYKGTVDLSDYIDGTYKLTVKIIEDNTQKLLAQETRLFKIKKYDSKIYIDYPKEEQNNKETLKIHGWIMSEEKEKEIKFYLGNTDITNNIRLYDRPDVTGTVKGYGTAEQNPNAGFDRNSRCKKYVCRNIYIKNPNNIKNHE